jgi:ribonucleoside-diphosphate reductase alpha chain
VPLEQYVKKFVNMRFDPAGLSDDADVRMAQSIMDYIFRRLALDYLPKDKRLALGILTADERVAQLDGETTDTVEPLDVDAVVEALAQSLPVEAPIAASAAEPVAISIDRASAHSSTELLESIVGLKADAPMCFTCGIKMRPAGSCFVCEGCGTTSGCS